MTIKDWVRQIVNNEKNFSQEIDGHHYKFSADLPLKSEIEDGEPYEVVEQLLDYFNFPHKSLKGKLRVKWIEKTTNGRTVLIDLRPSWMQFSLEAVPPEPASPPKIELYEEYKRRIGAVKADGSIDFRDSNKYPTIKKGEAVGEYIPETDGKIGRDLYGILTQLEKIEDVSSANYDPSSFELASTDSSVSILTALKDGVLNITREPPYCYIEIVDRLDLDDIDFSTGNIGSVKNRIISPISLRVIGDVKGLFSVSVEKDLEVRGTLQAKRVYVKGTSRLNTLSSARLSSENLVILSSSFHSVVEASEIELHREALESSFICRRFSTIPRGFMGQVYMASSTIEASEIRLSSVRISQSVKVALSPDDFKLFLEYKRKSKRLQEKLLSLTSEVKAGLFDLKEVVLSTKRNLHKELLKLLSADPVNGISTLRNKASQIQDELDLIFFKKAFPVSEKLQIYFDLSEKLKEFSKRIQKLQSILKNARIDASIELTPGAEFIVVSENFQRHLKNNSDTHQEIDLIVEFDGSDFVLDLSETNDIEVF